ncbi:multicopper oxidase family protein [Rhodococcus maanshanensis]|uniref:Multicopper oxidase with three cupredoxin domains (Includes cell division protein FtsP and spore coat protein CotA) n=1 Tax=Rhodococcus maanshanensis TaxID=183556 RepID=A0A1H7M385_9NOCA|nr:multicopper oxidase domain-containing protein [Rhodococcus maanshanensis]SEL05673.1 Multicopper oxidase with three cupredoxin domains (includes cell division protein FtsP and spore coat protein CotA) [Rhodococcus maanshanensis]
MELSRRGFFGMAGSVAALGWLGARAASAQPGAPVPPPPLPIPDLPPPTAPSPLNFSSSPPLRRFVTDLPRLPTAPASGTLTAQSNTHTYHPDLPASTVLGYHAGILGPTLEARRGAPTTVSFVNSIDVNPLADAVDLTMHGATEEDRTNPRTTVHLHGAPSRPDSDGHPLIAWRRGGVQTNHYANGQEAATLWYHDHVMANTRLNVQAGLAGFHLLRDEFDTGRAGNPLGLPAGEFEVPIVVQDRTFNADGTLQPRLARYQPSGYGQGGQFGDVAVVNGVAWPRMPVRRTLYRLRLLQGSNSRTYRFAFSNGMRFTVIGGDQGLLDESVDTDHIVMTSGERADLLVDFAELAPGESVTLVNTALNAFANAALAVPALPEIMRFDADQAPAEPVRAPARLRGGPGLPPAIAPATTDGVVRTRVMTFLGRFDLNRTAAVLPLMGSINNLPFLTGDIDVARAGTTEIWHIVNVFPLEHPVHLHLARFRILGRQKLWSAGYMAASPPPLENGIRWAPDPSPFLIGERAAPAPWEAGWKDTTLVESDAVLTLLVHWPSVDDLGFDPDAPIPVPHDAAGDHGSHQEVRGYTWHCHNLEHQDHDMMQQIQVRG